MNNNEKEALILLMYTVGAIISYFGLMILTVTSESLLILLLGMFGVLFQTLNMFLFLSTF